jgi:hypothetical protein
MTTNTRASVTITRPDIFRLPKRMSCQPYVLQMASWEPLHVLKEALVKLTLRWSMLQIQLFVAKIKDEFILGAECSASLWHRGASEAPMYCDRAKKKCYFGISGHNHNHSSISKPVMRWYQLSVVESWLYGWRVPWWQQTAQQDKVPRLDDRFLSGWLNIAKDRSMPKYV